MILALIPARAGSVRLPGKNMRMFAGKPLVQWTIEAADIVMPPLLVVASTNDPDVRTLVWRTSGGDVLQRPDVFCRGNWPMAAAMHAIIALKLNEDDWIMLLQPTSPLRTADDIRTVLKARERHGDGCSYFTCDEQNPDNGAIFLKRVDRLVADQSWKTGAQEHMRVQIPVDHGVDIDTLEDFERAEKIMLERLANEAEHG